MADKLTIRITLTLIVATSLASATSTATGTSTPTVTLTTIPTRTTAPSTTSTPSASSSSTPTATSSAEVLNVAGAFGCTRFIISGCNGKAVNVRLEGSTSRECFIVGDGAGNLDTSKCLSKTQTFDELTVREIAHNDVLGLALLNTNKMLFHNVAPDFGAFGTPGSESFPNTFSATSIFAVTLASSIDMSNVVNIPLIFCSGPGLITEDSCCGGPATRPSTNVLNAGGRAYVLKCAVGPAVTKALFPNFFPGKESTAVPGEFGVIFVELQPLPPSPPVTTVSSPMPLTPQLTSPTIAPPPTTPPPDNTIPVGVGVGVGVGVPVVVGAVAIGVAIAKASAVKSAGAAYNVYQTAKGIYAPQGQEVHQSLWDRIRDNLDVKKYRLKRKQKEKSLEDIMAEMYYGQQPTQQRGLTFWGPAPSPVDMVMGFVS